MKSIIIPKDFDGLRDRVMRTIAPIKCADTNTKADKNFLFIAKGSNSGRQLPAHYLVYFLLVDLLCFENLGRWEKIAWSIPIDLDGHAYLIEYRKFGLDIFAHDPTLEATEVARIVTLINKGVRTAEPFFKWIANRAASESKLNVRNKATELYFRFDYLRGLYKTSIESIEVEDSQKRAAGRVTLTDYCEQNGMPRFYTHREVSWLAIAVIEAFYSWTEHIFILIAILQGTITTAEQVSALALSDWSEKFRNALGISDRSTKVHYDALLTIKRQIRNVVAHGAFGKEGQAFDFHSSAGAVPVSFDLERRKTKYNLGPGLVIDDGDAMAAIDGFIAHLRTGPSRLALLYVQDGGLDVILPMAADGTYASAMKSERAMRDLVTKLCRQADTSANMDF